MRSDGEQAEFMEFFESSWTSTFRRAYAISGDYQLAEDTTQSAYVKAYKSWERIQRVDDPGAYLRRMVTN